MNKLNELAERVYKVDPWRAMIEDVEVEDIALSIKDDPLPVIEYLLEVIEDMRS